MRSPFRGGNGHAESSIRMDLFNWVLSIFCRCCHPGERVEMRDTIIRRQRKYEAEMAIADLEKRGFYVVFPLTEFTRDGKQFKRDSYNRRVFMNNTYSSCWIAKLRRVEES